MRAKQPVRAPPVESGHAERSGCPTGIAVGRGTCRDRSRTEDRRALL
ncbi:MAG: hypothetical protein MZV63_19360 [Marinilabiliales bacterium]|nr:hypothetical protein [Marinilabiliales bacterium]